MVVASQEMKILIFNDDFPPEARGGAGMVAFNLAKQYIRRGHNVLVVAATQDHSLVGKSQIENISVYRIFSKYNRVLRAYLSLYNFKIVRVLGKLIDDFKPDVVHVHNVHLHLSYHSIKLAKKAGAKVFLTAHDTMLYEYGKVDNVDKISLPQQITGNGLGYNPFRNVAIRYYLKYTDRIIAVSKILQQALNNNGINCTAVIYNGVDIKDWEVPLSAVEYLRNKYGLADKKVILFAGRLGGVKGSSFVIQAVSEIIKRVPETILFVAAPKQKLNQDHVVLSGWLDHEALAAAYHASDVVVFPSVYLDPFGMVNIEAMACAKPVVGTIFGGTPEIVVDGETGYLVDPREVKQLADKIAHLLADETLAAEFGKNGYERVKQHFTLESQASQYLQLFSSLSATFN
jgi:glycosyltransferase involved in cell wall biosynthesis